MVMMFVCVGFGYGTRIRVCRKNNNKIMCLKDTKNKKILNNILTASHSPFPLALLYTISLLFLYILLSLYILPPLIFYTQFFNHRKIVSDDLAHNFAGNTLCLSRRQYQMDEERDYVG